MLEKIFSLQETLFVRRGGESGPLCQKREGRNSGGAGGNRAKNDVEGAEVIDSAKREKR